MSAARKAFKGRSNQEPFILYKDEPKRTLTPEEMSIISHVELHFRGSYYKFERDHQLVSIDNSTATIFIRIGLIPDIPLGSDSKTELIVYDNVDNQAGIVWGMFLLKVVADAEPVVPTP